MKSSKRLLLQVRLHVYEYIAATNKVDLSKRWVFEKIMYHKNAHVAYFFIDQEPLISFCEKLCKTGCGNPCYFTFSIHAASRRSYGWLADVCGEYLGFLMTIACKFFQAHGYRIGFLPGTTAGYPYTYRFFLSFVLHDIWEHRFTQMFENCVIAKKSSHRYQQIKI